MVGASSDPGRLSACKPKLALVALAILVSVTGIPFPEGASARKPNCGERIGKDGGRNWRCTFADSFDRKRLNPRKWLPQRTETSGYLNGPTACFVDSPDNVSVSGGALKLTAREEPGPFSCRTPSGSFPTQYTSGMVSTAEGRFNQTYGRFEIRAKLWSAQVRGLQTALWLWPENPMRYGPWPASGEIDIAEMFSSYPDRAVPYLHYHPYAPAVNVTNNLCMISDLADYHTYALEWTKRRIKVIYDGKKCLDHRWRPATPLSSPQPFDHPFFVVLTQSLGVGDNAFDPTTTPLPATTTIDYVRVWK